MNARDVTTIAAAISNAKLPASREQLAEHFADWLAERYAKFDRDEFIKLASVDADEIKRQLLG